MWRLALSDRSFPGSFPETIFEQARRMEIVRLVMRDEVLRPPRRWNLGWRRGRELDSWREVSQWAEALDYSRSRLWGLRLERLRAGVRLIAWGIAPRLPRQENVSRIQRYASTAATAAAFLGAHGLLLEGTDHWEPGEAIPFIQHLLPVLGSLRLILWLRLSEVSPLLLDVPRLFPTTIRPWIALDLEVGIPEAFPALWDRIKSSVSMMMFRCEPGHLEWWDREGRVILERTEFSGELVVTVPEIPGKSWESWRHLVRGHRLSSEF
ncbi:MAG: hypothetical protein RMK32_05945 [Anaerolineae bacterium]|nr:hypothetical protein [Thermoflexus sp.]MDW8065154.1 hypothetical protein [Anaerolineae bacterium]